MPTLIREEEDRVVRRPRCVAIGPAWAPRPKRCRTRIAVRAGGPNPRRVAGRLGLLAGREVEEAAISRGWGRGWWRGDGDADRYPRGGRRAGRGAGCRG